MELNLITGRAGAGKSRLCIEEIAGICSENPGNPVFLIVPEQFAVQAERRLLEAIPSGGLLNNEVLSFKRLTHRVLNQYGGVHKKILNLAGRSMVLSHAFHLCRKQLEYYRDFSRNIWDTEKIMGFITELVRYGIGPEQLTRAWEAMPSDGQSGELTVKLRELSLVYSCYKQLLSAEYMDELDMHSLLIEKLESERPFQNAVFWIDEFTGFTTLELEIIDCLVLQCNAVNVCLPADEQAEQIFRGVHFTARQLSEIGDRAGCGCKRNYLAPKPLPRFLDNSALAVLEREFSRYPCVPCEEVPRNIQIRKCTDIHQEVYNSALEIQRLCSEEGLRFCDISVTVRDLSLYKNVISAIYPLMGISYFMDERMSLDRHPLTSCILDALDIIAGGWRYDSVFSFLKSGYYPAEKPVLDRLENYVLAVGLKGKTGWEKPVPDPECEALRTGFMSKMNCLYEELRGSKTYRDALLSLCRFLDSLKIQERLELGPAGGRDIWGVITEVFGQLRDFLGDQPCGGIARTAEELKELLRNGFAKHTVGTIPESNDCVQIGAADRSRSHEIEALLVLGANEGIFPASFRDDGLLSDEERELLQAQGIVLSETMKSRAFLEQFLIYRTLTSPKRYLTVSYSLDTGGGSGRPSWLVRRIRTIFPRIPVAQGEPVAGFGLADLSCIPRTPERALSQDIAVKLFYRQESPAVSISGMEKYMECPYRFFLEDGLQARPRAAYSVESFDTGSFLHLLLEYGTRQLLLTKERHAVTREECEAVIKRAVPEALGVLGNLALTGTARNRFLTGRLIRFAADSLYAAAGQCLNSAYLPGGFEVKFGYPGKASLPPVEIQRADGSRVYVKGKIDRYDYWDWGDTRYFRIIDYKSSSHWLKPGEVFDGCKMQLVTYMDAVESALVQTGKKTECGGVFYFNIPSDRTKKPDYSLKGMVYNSPENIEAMAGESGEGGLSVRKSGISGCSQVPEGGFPFLKDRVRENILGITEKLRQGKIPALPRQTGLQPPCKYCKFGGVCGFSGTVKKGEIKDDCQVWDLKNKGI